MDDNHTEEATVQADEAVEPVTEERLDTVSEEDSGVEDTFSEEAPPEEQERMALEARLAEAEQKVAEYMDGWQRCQATFANYRKRTEAEQANLRQAANAALLGRFLPIVDDFQRAFQSVPDELAENSWLEGIALIQRKVFSLLETEGVTEIALETGDLFDPMYHQAVFHQETDEFEDGQVVTEVGKGYMLGDRVLRHSMVVVAKSTASIAKVIEGEVRDVAGVAESGFDPAEEGASDSAEPVESET